MCTVSSRISPEKRRSVYRWPGGPTGARLLNTTLQGRSIRRPEVTGASVRQASRTLGAIMDEVRRAVSGRSWLVFGVAVTTAWLPICGLACAFPLDGALPESHQEVRRGGECAAHAGARAEDGSDSNRPANPCRQSHNNGVEIGSLTAKSSHGAVLVVLVGPTFAPLLTREPIVTGPSVVSVPPSFSPLAIALRI